MKGASEKSIDKAVEQMEKILSKFNLADACYVLDKLKAETMMQLVGIEFDKVVLLQDDKDEKPTKKKVKKKATIKKKKKK